MELTRTIDKGQYKFEITISSKSEHAHSLITDNKDGISIQLGYLSNFISELVAQHKLTKK